MEPRSRPDGNPIRRERVQALPLTAETQVEEHATSERASAPGLASRDRGALGVGSTQISSSAQMLSKSLVTAFQGWIRHELSGALRARESRSLELKSYSLEKPPLRAHG